MEEKWRHSNIRFWGKQLTEKKYKINWMGVLIGAQRHVNWFDQGFKCFAIYLTWGWQAIVLLNLKQVLKVGDLIIYIHFLYVWLAHFIYMLEVIEESQENTEIMRRHEAHGRFWLLRKSRPTDETHSPKQRTNNYFRWSLTERSARNNWGKISMLFQYLFDTKLRDFNTIN